MALKRGIVELAEYNSNWKKEYEKEEKLLKEVLGILDSNYKKVITNFAKYKNLLFISAKYMELSLLEKQNFLVELLFKIFQYDFNDEEINIIINQKLNVYDYYYSLNLL